jgi:hypothetical protein
MATETSTTAASTVVTAPADAPTVSVAARQPAPREASARYTLIQPPSYEGIVGGVRPSPFVSLILLLGLLGLVGAAIASGLGYPVDEWWMFGLLFVVVSTTLAGFISRSA